MKTEEKKESTPTKSSSISVLDKNKTNALIASFNETLMLQLAEHKAGIRSTLKEIFTYEKIQNQNLHHWEEFQAQEEKEQARISKVEQHAKKYMMDIDLDTCGI